jgi:hypothetical protein
MLLMGVLAQGAESNDLADQLVGLGQQALAQGRPADAHSFYDHALRIDPKNGEARRALQDPVLRKIAFRQDAVEADPEVEETPAPPVPDDAAPAAEAPASEAPAPAIPPPATLERAQELEAVLVQRLTADTHERIQKARDLVNAEYPQVALDTLRLALSAVESDDQVPQNVRDTLAREIRMHIQTTVRREEEIEMVQAERLRLEQAAVQRARVLSDLATREETVNTLMTQFDALMSEGHYNVLFNGGGGDIAQATAPFYTARIVAQQARALDPRADAPRAGVLVSQFEGFLAQALAFEELKEYRFMLTLQDVDRASVPFPDTITIEYPSAEFFREITERRIKKYESSDLVSRDGKTLAILNRLDQPMPMPFGQETPLGDVIKYIKNATITPTLPSGIPIYVDPIGLEESEKTIDSPVTLDLDGVSLKKSLKLMLKQLGLAYTVKDGLMTITAELSKDVPTEIRVYPVADLAIIPMSLMMGGGGGGMGGRGMGGMGGGMGGMGGGMGGMGGGMGGMGGGMGGFGSVPLSAPEDTGAAVQKKRT